MSEVVKACRERTGGELQCPTLSCARRRATDVGDGPRQATPHRVLNARVGEVRREDRHDIRPDSGEGASGGPTGRA